MAEVMEKKESIVKEEVALRAFELMSTAKSLTELYEANVDVCSKYVHATSRGHEAIQIACGLQLKPQDFVFPYYRDCLLYTSPSPRDLSTSRMPSSA